MTLQTDNTDARQQANINWWESKPMIYDNWTRDPLPQEPGSREWFEEIDRRFFSANAAWFAQEPGETPFSKLIPFERLNGRRVLEVGCGSGAHAKLLAQSGAQLTCIDITERGVETTRRRLQAYGLSADVRRMDAEKLEFDDESFDFVWSWGVIHHSAHTDRAAAQIARVLRAGGEARMMVYHRRSVFAAYAAVAGLLYGRLFRMSYDDVLASFIDGDTARFYTRDSFAKLLQPHFSRVESEVFGQLTDIFPFPGNGPLARVKLGFAHATPRPLAEALLRRWGYFLFVTATK